MTQERVEVRFRRVAGALDLPAPARATAESVGFDLRARVEDEVEIGPGERRLVPTGVAVALPPGFEAQVRPRSGLALRQGLTLVNSPGTVDSDYRGEIAAVLINLGREPVRVRRGDRIAQLVVQRAPAVTLVEVEDLPESARGAGGFGSSGER
jgi:dUTP pyrophosphatase